MRVLAEGGTQIRTGGGGFADLCLTTWLCRHSPVFQTISLPFSRIWLQSWLQFSTKPKGFMTLLLYDL